MHFISCFVLNYLVFQDSRELTLEHKPYIQGSRDVLETAAAQAGIVTVVVGPGTLLTTSPSPSLSLSSLSPLSSISSPPSSSRTSQHQPPPTPSCPAPGKDKNRKKSKTKTQPKTRTIKFHEYKVRYFVLSLVSVYHCLVEVNDNITNIDRLILWWRNYDRDKRCHCVLLTRVPSSTTTIGIYFCQPMHNMESSGAHLLLSS